MFFSFFFFDGKEVAWGCGVHFKKREIFFPVCYRSAFFQSFAETDGGDNQENQGEEEKKKQVVPNSAEWLVVEDDSLDDPEEVGEDEGRTSANCWAILGLATKGNIKPERA